VLLRQGANPRAVSRALLLSEETFGLVLLVLLRDTYPPTDEYPQQPLDWAPETIKRQLEQDFAVELPRLSFDKLMAAVFVLTSNRFFKDVNSFIEVCNVFSGDEFRPDVFDPAGPAEILWGVTEACLIYPPNDDPEDTEFSQEVRVYIGEALKEDGIVRPPDVLRLGLTGDVAGRIDTDYADDPDMYQAIYKGQQGKNDDLAQMLRENLAAMTLQLKLLPLQHGTTDVIVRQLQQIAGRLPAAQPV
jgi:hypothetical protein